MKALREELAIDPHEFEPNLCLGAMLNEGREYKEAQPYLTRALQVRPGAPQVRYQIALAQIGMGKLEEARKTLDTLVKDAPNFVEAHASLATLDYRLHGKQDGDREMAIVAKLYAEIQAQKEAGAVKTRHNGNEMTSGGKTHGTSPKVVSPYKPGADLLPGL